MHKTDPTSTWNINYLSTVNHTSDEVDRSCQKVQFQQVFASRKGSHYIQIQTKETTEHTGTPDQNRASQVIDELERFYQEQQRQTSNVIQAGEHDEANPWLRRTRWPVYLTNIAPNDLVNCVQRPDDDTTCPDELAARAIWEAMGQVARTSQRVITRLGHFVRIEAIRTERHQTRHTPLQAYMDEESIAEHVRPWQQMLMFFARTQVEHEWTSPQYRFTPRQRKTWRVLWQVATTEGADQRHPISPDPMDEQMTEEEEEEEEKGQRDTQPEEEDKFKLTKMQMACLDFCIELLNQRVQVEDYECALVDALAVLGRGEYGWCDAESYPPMLSRIIKVARFMVVHKALRLDANASDMLARNQASQMVGEWAVVSPMEEADYTFTGNQNEGNTTPGHVGWMGGDELLYKDMHFTMGDFRGFTHGLVGATRRILREELLFENELNGQQPPAIPWSTMRDDPTQGGTGWNFLKDSRTRWPVDGAQWLMQQMRIQPGMQRRFIQREHSDRPRLAIKAINAYLRWVVRFREKLSVAVHVTAGQPARAPELLSVRHINTENGGHRNIFIEDGMVVFVTRYHKGFHASNDIKVIHRYLPREVGELVVWYLWLVLPFAQRLQEYRRRIREEEGNPEEENANQRGAYMWGGDPDGRAWTSERFREVLKRETRIGLHAGRGGAGGRHH
ncbi:conserved hypothetical protein [Histoplasma mississippiense (nom. inval.)]|uniref:conserved hypothetical protein n=1 Tax=Ajellomyces capsulatus (strain NAm1 / WU24) TaxID=2059318 RepID=UPI000157D238|nr:conserved hypothetical protein [Histoplasma mississippiense (nom. inval.)]EDN04610.1 conserved hypothetical protein [Histoplasma mississippiense (nom. inval.)]